MIGTAAALGLAAAIVWHRPAAPVALSSGTLLSPRRTLPDFSLIDARGQPFGSKNLRGQWSMLFFGYTHCPDFCPTTLTALAAMQRRLAASGASVRPRVIFVSVDAARDTPALLAEYVPYFDPGFIGLTARDQGAVEAVAHGFGVEVILNPKRADGSYAVDHSGDIFVIDPEGRAAAVLVGPFTVEALTADFQRIAAGRA